MNSRQLRQRRIRLFREQVGLCAGCGEAMDLNAEGDEQPTLDHIKPRSLGGTAGAWNMQLMHKRCNYEKGSTPPWKGR